MNYDPVKRIADAVLYEGYILYPYRASAVKNRHRFNFGTLYPQSYSAAGHGGEAWNMRTECIVVGRQPRLDVQVRFLQLVRRQIQKSETSSTAATGSADVTFSDVELLRVGNTLFQSWQEACEREAVAHNHPLTELVEHPQQTSFSFPAHQETELLSDDDGRIVGRIVRDQLRVEGTLELSATQLESEVFRFRLSVANQFPSAGSLGREDAQLHALASLHAILSVQGGHFVSLLDPPGQLCEAASGCRNVGVWPVLVGEEGEQQMMLASPIILYDYPQVAPESSGDFFDATEIDEMLALRIMTLTEDEKRAMQDVDDRARALLERTDSLPPEDLMKLHGVVRGLKPS